jgi:glycosyltransferase involved in cell wall biosynthesis
VKLVLFLGRLSKKKSPDLLLRAFGELLKRSAGIGTILVFAGPGEGEIQEQLDHLASQLGVDSRVRFVGPVFGESKWAAYRDADVFVLPSQNENFGNTAAEAVAAGTPVIVTEHCGVASLVANEAGLVVPHETEALAKALERVLGDAEVRVRLTAGCARVVARLGWDAPVKEMEEIYSTLTARGQDRIAANGIAN